MLPQCAHIGHPLGEDILSTPPPPTPTTPHITLGAESAHLGSPSSNLTQIFLGGNGAVPSPTPWAGSSSVGGTQLAGWSGKAAPSPWSEVCALGGGEAFLSSSCWKLLAGKGSKIKQGPGNQTDMFTESWGSWS